MTTFLTSPVIQNGSVKLKKYDGTPQLQWERAMAHFLLVFAIVAIVAGLYLLATSNLGPVQEPTQPAPGQNQPVQPEPERQPALNV